MRNMIDHSILKKGDFLIYTNRDENYHHKYFCIVTNILDLEKAEFYFFHTRTKMVYYINDMRQWKLANEL